jgi:hypothetical protein
MINPRGVKIVANTVGFFIANDAEEVRRANAFCKVRKRAKFVVVFVGFGVGEAGNIKDQFFLKDSMYCIQGEGPTRVAVSKTEYN